MSYAVGMPVKWKAVYVATMRATPTEIEYEAPREYFEAKERGEEEHEERTCTSLVGASVRARNIPEKNRPYCKTKG